MAEEPTPGYLLLVEDDRSLLHTMARNLAVRGYRTTTAASVKEALAAIEVELPSLLLLDIDLPDGSGWEILRTLRAQGGKSVPVMVISAMRPNSRLVAELKCVAVLEKPFPMESLVRLVTESLKLPQGTDAS